MWHNLNFKFVVDAVVPRVSGDKINEIYVCTRYQFLERGSSLTYCAALTYSQFLDASPLMEILCLRHGRILVVESGAKRPHGRKTDIRIPRRGRYTFKIHLFSLHYHVENRKDSAETAGQVSVA